MLFLLFHFTGYFYISWIIGIIILLIIISNLFLGSKKLVSGAGKEFLRDMETDMEKATGKTPDKKYLTEIVKETGRKTGEALAPEDYTYKLKDPWVQTGQGSKNFLDGLKKIFRK